MLLERRSRHHERDVERPPFTIEVLTELLDEPREEIATARDNLGVEVRAQTRKLRLEHPTIGEPEQADAVGRRSPYHRPERRWDPRNTHDLAIDALTG